MVSSTVLPASAGGDGVISDATLIAPVAVWLIDVGADTGPVVIIGSGGVQTGAEA